ncbi:Transposase [Caballeronia sordidicola]|uniref:Transposase n=1 Tax=Caballeronia sordidicola TaxID=196367 RepID=A0A226WVV2_CABSO|nr:Transposase [Caballeronia sordidicola]
MTVPTKKVATRWERSTRKIGWIIPPQANAEFVVAMENVLDIYHHRYDAARPVVCVDETPQ